MFITLNNFLNSIILFFIVFINISFYTSEKYIKEIEIYKYNYMNFFNSKIKNNNLNK
jgi:hypothetical protein